MRKQTDLAAMKQLARVFLMMDPEPTSFSPVIIKHPFTDSGIVTVRSGNEYRAADITADEAVRSQWREQMASLIENAETPRHIYMMLTKSYRFAFLKYAMPYFSQKDFSEYLANAWVMCESPNNDPNFTQKQMLGLFKKADPQVLMDEDEYKQFQALEDRNPTRSNGNNLLHLVNKYMDLYQAHPDQLVYKARCEKYAKIISKTIILSGMDAASFGQNAYFYDAAEGLLTATILLVAEFCEPKKRHIVSVFKIIQELLAPSGKKGKNQFQQLMELLPNDHKAKWFAGAALNTAEQSMASVMSTALSRLNAFLDSELEQILCFDTEIDAEKFCKEKSALFIIMPEENPATFFMISLITQQLYREILAVADENGGKLKNRCVFFCDEFGTLPKIESAEMMFSASRSRRLQIVPIIQSFSQLEKNYGKEGAEIIIDNTQLTIFGGFAPQSTSAETLSKALGSCTVMSGSVSRSKNDPSESLQMIERPLMTPDELKSMPKGQFVVMKTGFYPMKVKLKLFFKWGIRFDEEHPYVLSIKGSGTEKLPVLSFESPGVHTYTISQIKGSNSQCSYDETVYTMKVYVTNNENGPGLVSEIVLTVPGMDGKPEHIIFVNKYPTVPDDPDDPDGPQTGDSSHLWLYICLGAVSLTALVTLFLTKRRKSEQ